MTPSAIPVGPDALRALAGTVEERAAADAERRRTGVAWGDGARRLILAAADEYRDDDPMQLVRTHCLFVDLREAGAPIAFCGEVSRAAGGS